LNGLDLGVCITASPDAYDIKWDFLPYIVPNPKDTAAVETTKQSVQTPIEKITDLQE
jgi:hypothetical protein